MKIDKAKALALISQGPENALIFGSGHNLYEIGEYLKWGSVIGLKESDIKDLEKKHYSDGTNKGTISVEGRPVEYMIAIDNKDILMWMSDLIGASIGQHSWINGRGTWARAVNATIYDRLTEIAGIDEKEAEELRKAGIEAEEEEE